jgi:hypothetical protein
MLRREGYGLLGRTFNSQDGSASAAEGCLDQHNRCPQGLKPVEIGWLMAEVEYDMHTTPPACTYAQSTGKVDPCSEVGHCLMDVVALGLHYGARTGLY